MFVSSTVLTVLVALPYACSSASWVAYLLPVSWSGGAGPDLGRALEHERLHERDPGRLRRLGRWGRREDPDTRRQGALPVWSRDGSIASVPRSERDDVFRCSHADRDAGVFARDGKAGKIGRIRRP